MSQNILTKILLKIFTIKNKIYNIFSNNILNETFKIIQKIINSLN